MACNNCKFLGCLPHNYRSFIFHKLLYSSNTSEYRCYFFKGIISNKEILQYFTLCNFSQISVISVIK